MGSMSIYHWIILGIVVLVLFGGGGKISSLMGDFAKGIKSFKKNMAEEDSLPDQSSSVGRPHSVPPSVEHQEQQGDVNMSDHISSSPQGNPQQNPPQQDKR